MNTIRGCAGMHRPRSTLQDTVHSARLLRGVEMEIEKDTDAPTRLLLWIEVEKDTDTSTRRRRKLPADEPRQESNRIGAGFGAYTDTTVQGPEETL